MVYLKFLIAALLRYWMMNIDYWDIIANRVEVATPLNSWKRLIEGIYLYDHDINPYDGDFFHESPIMLVIFHLILKKIPHMLPMIFTMMDLFTAYLLYKTAKAFVEQLKIEQKTKSVSEDSKTMQLSDKQLEEASEYVLFIYLFNPYSVLNCVGFTTTVVQNFMLATSLCSAVKGRGILACVSLAFASFQALYPVLLIVPYMIMLQPKDTNHVMRHHIKTLLIFMFSWVLLINLSAYIMNGSFQYLQNTYGLILSASDFKPNIGLFWYFFTEMFDHFRLLFTCAFQINALALYIIPLTLRFKDEPMLLTTILIALSAIFRSYPCIGDVGFYLSLLPMWQHLLPFMQQKFIVGCALFITTALGPAVWHLWIYSGSANANFFFGVTLTFATMQIFLLTDLVFAFVKREFILKHGNSREVDGKPVKLVLA